MLSSQLKQLIYRSTVQTDCRVFISTRSNNRFFKVFESDRSNQRFPRLKLFPSVKDAREARTEKTYDLGLPRYKRITPLRNYWRNIWPAARTFEPATVPLPIFMNYVDDHKHLKPVGKYGNTELMKIPNFLHLSPPIIAIQCNAIKKFCTKWPTELKTDEDCEKHFPVTVTTKDLVFSAPSIRWPDARIVEIKVKLSRLKLDDHARNKMIKLLGHRYDPESDMITIKTDSCPLRKQNYDYAQYLLTAVYFESWKTEPWELENQGREQSLEEVL